MQSLFIELKTNDNLNARRTRADLMDLDDRLLKIVQNFGDHLVQAPSR